MLQTVLYIDGDIMYEDILNHLSFVVDNRVSDITHKRGSDIDVYSCSGEYMNEVKSVLEAQILSSFSENRPAYAINTRYVLRMCEWVRERGGLLRWKNPFDNHVHEWANGLSEMASDAHLYEKYVDTVVYGLTS